MKRITVRSPKIETLHVEIKISGPRACGKSHFAKKQLIPFLKECVKSIAHFDEGKPGPWKSIKGKSNLNFSAEVIEIQIPLPKCRD